MMRKKDTIDPNLEATPDNKREKRTIKILIIIIILLLLFIVSFLAMQFYYNRFGNGKVPAWVPEIDSNVSIDKTKPDENTPKQAPGYASIVGHPNYSIKAYQSENVYLGLENPHINTCYFSFKVMLKDTSEILYESKLVPPGGYINFVNLSRGLDPGDYNVVIMVSTYDMKTGVKNAISSNLNAIFNVTA